MVIVAITVEEVRFVAVNVGIFPEPEAINPIEGVLFVHAKVDPATGPDTGVIGATLPLQYCCDAILLTVGVGNTVMV